MTEKIVYLKEKKRIVENQGKTIYSKTHLEIQKKLKETTENKGSKRKLTE